MRLTKQTSHAIRILIDCARAEGRLVKVAEMAERLEITQQNVFKIVHLLSRAGFVRAVRGRHGGVRLALSPAGIRVGDVVRATEVTRVEVEDIADAAEGSRVPINKVLDDALDAFISVLDQHTLADMAELVSPASTTAKRARRRGSRAARTPVDRRTEPPAPRRA